MHHLAIMNKKWGMVSKILSGEKTIESRWYQKRICPWGKVEKGDIIYFKNTGEPVSVRSQVSGVIQYSQISANEVQKILDKYSDQLGMSKAEARQYFEKFKNKKYCLLLLLDKTEEVVSFQIDKNKAGCSPRSAWITVDNIDKIKVNFMQK